MAEIRTEVTLENAADRWLVRHGHATEPEVRHTTVDGIVDTRVATLRLPQNVVERLGLRRQGTAFVMDADKRLEERPRAGPVTVRIGNREMLTECVVEASPSEPLIGLVVLGMLDLIADSAKGTLTPRHPDGPVLRC